MKEFFDALFFDYSSVNIREEDLKPDCTGWKAIKYLIFILCNLIVNIIMKVFMLVFLLFISIGIGLIAMLSSWYEAFAAFITLFKNYTKLIISIIKRI